MRQRKLRSGATCRGAHKQRGMKWMTTVHFYVVSILTFYVNVTVHRDKFLILTNQMHQFLKFTFEGNSTCFGQFLHPPSGVFHCTHSNGICHMGFSDSLEAGSGWNQFHPDPACKLSEKPVWHILLLCVQWKTPDGGRRNCPKHAEFPSKINLRNWCIWLLSIRNLTFYSPQSVLLLRYHYNLSSSLQ